MFGSKAYAHIPKELRKKLDEKAKEYFFVGYAENEKGYRLLDISTDKVVISRDVKFLDKEESNEIIIEIKKQEKHDNKENTENQEKEEEGISKVNNKNQEIETPVQEEKNEQLRRSQRLNKGIPPYRYCNLAYHTRQDQNVVEPDTYKEAIASSNSTEWVKSMNEEYDSLMKAGTWTLVDKPIDKNVIGCRWIYKSKTDAEGRIVR